MEHIFFWIFALALIPYPGFHFLPLFWAADIIGSTNGDVWDEVATSSTHLSQHILHTFYEVSNADAFVFKKRTFMEPMNDETDKGEGEQEGMTKDHKTMRKVMTSTMESKVQMKKPTLQVMEKTIPNTYNLPPRLILMMTYLMLLEVLSSSIYFHLYSCRYTFWIGY